MAEITASMVKDLREKTDAPMMDCKKALTEAGGDMQKAEEILRVRFGNKAAKSAGRVAAEGESACHVQHLYCFRRSPMRFSSPLSCT